MNAITTQAQNLPTIALIENKLIYDYIAFIDRGEKTTRTYLNNLRQFINWVHEESITEPQREDIIAYREHLEISCKPNTVKQYIQTVRHFYKWLSSKYPIANIAENIHTPKVDQEQHKKEAFTAADVLIIEESIKAHAELRTAAAAESAKDTEGRIDRSTEQGKRLFAMYLLAVNAGLRTIELHRANIKDIEQWDGQAYIYIYGKGRTEADQKKPIAPQVFDALQDYISCRKDNPTKDSPLFVSTGNRSGGKRIATTTISTMLKRAMQAAGYDSERLTAHSLRHTAGNEVMELTGDNLFMTQQYMRHKNPKTTEIYLHRKTERQEAEIAQKLYNKYHVSNGTWAVIS